MVNSEVDSVAQNTQKESCDTQRSSRIHPYDPITDIVVLATWLGALVKGSQESSSPHHSVAAQTMPISLFGESRSADSVM